MFKPGQSGNIDGRPKGAIGNCTKVKNDYFRVYQALGGYKGFLKYMRDNRALWPDFFLRVLPSLMPKRTHVEGNISGTFTAVLSPELSAKLDEILSRKPKP